MPASASSRAKEETGAALQLGEIIPKTRESDFFSQPQESGQTEEKIGQRLVAGMRGIEGVKAKTKDALASRLARKLISLGDGAKIEEKTCEILVALPKIAQAAGEGAGWAFEALSNDKIADLFLKDPAKLIASFRGIAQAAGEGADGAFEALSNDKIAGLFSSHSSEFVQIAQVVGKYAYWAFKALTNDKTASDFIAWCECRLGKEKFLISLLSLNDVAIEIGRPLDDLHNEDLRNPNNKRTAYLNKLPAETVLALLCSDPEFFYTSSNNLLFDRLASDIKNGKF